MTLPEVWAMERFWAKYPPVDLLVAAYLGFKPPAENKRMSRRDAARANAEAMNALPPRRNQVGLEKMPAFLRTPEMLKALEEWKSAG